MSAEDKWGMAVVMAASGACWVAAYVLIIVRSFIDRSYGMPLAALALNIAWEGTFSFIYPHTNLQLYVNIVWFGLDCIILLEVLWFGPREFPRQPLWRFYPGQ